MIPCLEEINLVHADEVYQTVLLSKAPRPRPRCKILERFRLTEPLKWIPQNSFNKVERS